MYMLHFALLLALDEDLMPGEAAAGKMLLNKAIMIWHVYLETVEPAASLSDSMGAKGATRMAANLAGA